MARRAQQPPTPPDDPGYIRLRDGSYADSTSGAALLPAPSAGDVWGLYRQRLQSGDEADLRTTMKRVRLLCDMQHPLEIPETYRAITTEIRTPFARDSWLRITAALTQQAGVAHVTPRQDTDEMKRAANVAERWTNAAFANMLRPSTQDVPYEAIRQLVRDQESVIKVVHRPDAWANFPSRQPRESAGDYNERADAFNAMHFPFGWRAVDRLQMLFGDGEFGDDWALEYGEYPRPYLAGRYGMTEVADRDGERSLVNPANLLGGSPKPEGYLIAPSGRSVKLELWNEDWWAVVVDGDLAPGFPKRNPYAPRLPYFRAQVSDPILQPLLWLVPALDALLTMHTNWAYLGAYPNPVIESVPNTGIPTLSLLPTGGDPGPGGITWVPGKAMELPMGRTMRFMSPPPVGVDIEKMEGMLRQLIDVAGVPSVFRGVGGSDQAGYAINQLVAAATLTYKILARQGEQQMAQIGEFLWWCVANRIQQTVYVDDPLSDKAVESVGLAPDGKASRTVAPITMLRSLTYTFRPVLPTDEQARAMIAMQLVNAPKQLISKEYALEHYLQVEDPQKMQDDIWVEQTLDTDPQLHTRVVGEALRQAGLAPAEDSPVGAAMPPSGLLGPNGQPISSGNNGGGSPPNGPTPYPPGQAGNGMPALPGLTQPATPTPPGAPSIVTGGRAAGAYPGQPGGPQR